MKSLSLRIAHMSCALCFGMTAPGALAQEPAPDTSAEAALVAVESGIDPQVSAAEADSPIAQPDLADANGAEQAAPTDDAWPEAEVALAGPISLEPLPVELKLWIGQLKQYRTRTKIAPVGYNVTAFLTASETATSMGTLTTQASKAKLEYRTTNITPELIEEIATAAHADLVAQLEAAGIETVPLDVIRSHADAVKLGLQPEPVNLEVQDVRAKKKAATMGPSGFGVNTFSSINPKVANANGTAKMSMDLDAVLLFPNLALDFVATGGTGQSFFGSKAKVEGEVIFSVDPQSKVFGYASKSGRFSDAMVYLMMEKDTASPEFFATTQALDKTNNTAVQEISNAWGFDMMGKSKVVTGVTVDQTKYKELALRAARGFNSEIVARIKKGREG